MPRMIWKGAISFGLVHVPVALYPGSQEIGIDCIGWHTQFCQSGVNGCGHRRHGGGQQSRICTSSLARPGEHTACGKLAQKRAQ